MKSFRQYITEQDKNQLPIYGISGRPHLPHISVSDSKGNEHIAPFHSELKNGKIRYDFTDAAKIAREQGAFLAIGGKKVGEKELEYHHGRSFRGDVFSEAGARGLGKQGIQLITYTPDKSDDDDEEETSAPEPPKPTLKKSRRIPSPIFGRKIYSRIKQRV